MRPREIDMVAMTPSVSLSALTRPRKMEDISVATITDKFSILPQPTFRPISAIPDSDYNRHDYALDIPCILYPASLLFNHTPFNYEDSTFNIPYLHFSNLGLPTDTWHAFQKVLQYERKRKKTIIHSGYYKILQRNIDYWSINNHSHKVSTINGSPQPPRVTAVEAQVDDSYMAEADTDNDRIEDKSMLFNTCQDMPAIFPILKLPITDICFTTGVGTITLQALWDTGALHGNYMTQQTFDRLQHEAVDMVITPCNIRIKLADGITLCDSSFACHLPATFTLANTSHTIELTFNIIKDSTNSIHDVIIGWPAITHELNVTFIELLQSATRYGHSLPTSTVDSVAPDNAFIASIMASINSIWQADDQLFESALPEKTPVTEEELELRGTDDTNYLGDSYDAELTKYTSLIDSQVAPELLSHPGFREFITNVFIHRCVPKEWTGLTGIEPVKMRFREDMPTYFNNTAIPVAFKMKQRFAEATRQYIKYLYTTFSDYGWGHPCFLTPKPNGGWRLVVNFNGSAKDGKQGVNAYIEPPLQLRTKALEALVGFMKKEFLQEPSIK